MPYSKNPDKYPLELQQLPHMLRNATQAEYNIAAGNESEAKGRRTQIQTYFSAVERRAQEMRALATKPGLAPEARADANAIADTWETRARTVAQWIVRTTVVGGTAFVQIARRTTGAFGEAMTAAFAGTPTSATDTAAPPDPNSLEAQLALLRQASAALQARESKN